MLGLTFFLSSVSTTQPTTPEEVKRMCCSITKTTKTTQVTVTACAGSFLMDSGKAYDKACAKVRDVLK